MEGTVKFFQKKCTQAASHHQRDTNERDAILCRKSLNHLLHPAPATVAMVRMLASTVAMLSVASAAANSAPPPPPPHGLLPLCPTQPSPDAPKFVPVINLTKCAHGCADLPQCASITPGGVCLQKCSLPQFPADTGRRLMAWVGGDVDNQANRDSLGGMA